MPVENLRSKKFEYLFERVYYKKARLQPSERSIKLLENTVSEILKDKTSFSNLEIALHFLTILEVLPLKFAFDKPKIGIFKR